MQQVPPPESRALLLPLLACLPASFISPKPPPALIPLLSPILGQRLNYLQNASNKSDGWLPLLSWDEERGAKLPEIVERMDLEPHPVSGELELDELPPPKYRRLDEETLHARLEADQFDLVATFIWCEGDQRSGTESGWRVAELWALEDMDDGTNWFDSQTEANDVTTTTTSQTSKRTTQATNNDDDDDYWASYDQTATETPAQELSRIAFPPTSSSQVNNNNSGSRSETDYYDRYGAEVQPALDAHDPDEVAATSLHGSTLNGNALFQPTPDPPARASHSRMVELQRELSMPRPISSASSRSSVDKLEARAAATHPDQSSMEDQAQLAIKQHISTDIKSLFRLAKSAGIDRTEFERIVRTELEMLSMLEQDG